MVDLLLEAKASTKMVTNDTQSSCLHIAAKNNAVRRMGVALEAPFRRLPRLWKAR